MVVIALCYIGVYVNSRQSSSSLAEKVDGESARRREQRDSNLRSKIGVFVATILVCLLPIITIADYVFISGNDMHNHKIIFCL